MSTAKDLREKKQQLLKELFISQQLVQYPSDEEEKSKFLLIDKRDLLALQQIDEELKSENGEDGMNGVIRNGDSLNQILSTKSQNASEQKSSKEINGKSELINNLKSLQALSPENGEGLPDFKSMRKHSSFEDLTGELEGLMKKSISQDKSGIQNMKNIEEDQDDSLDKKIRDDYISKSD